MITKELEDKLSIRELIDNVSILGDKKDFKSQVLLFTENAISETYTNGKAILKLQGRTDMIKAFDDLLKDIETVYHFNGQQVVALKGDRATGTCYCLITLISNESGKKIKTTIGAIYQDEYICEGNRWLINKRIGKFKWQEKSVNSLL